MTAPLDTFGYLLRSEHRVAVLGLLAEEPRTRAEIREETDVTRVTVSRMLGELEERRWIERDGDAYRATPLGELLAADVARLEETAAAVERLEDVIQWLPADDLDVDVRHLADARVTLADESDPTSPARRYASVLREADRIRILSSAAKPSAIRQHRETLAQKAQPFEIVHTTAALDAITADPEMRGWVRDIMEPGKGTYFHYRGSLPCNLLIADGTAVLSLIDAQGTRPGVIESEADAVLDWARETFEDYRREAEAVDVASFDSWSD